MVLDIDTAAGKKEILQHVIAAMKKRQYDAKTIAQAQKSLFNPSIRAVEEFQYCITTIASANKQIKMLTESYTIPDLIDFTNE